jgi:hypothetical protein
MARGKTTEVRPRGRMSDRYFDLIREFPLRPIGLDAEPDRAIAMIDRLLARDELSRSVPRCLPPNRQLRADRDDRYRRR